MLRYGPIAGESKAYQEARTALHQAELALRDQREKVAQLRRKLPRDTHVQDYLFQEGPSDLAKDGPVREVHLSGLFEEKTKPLVLYQFMYGVAQKKPCPMCSLWIDGFQGIARHLRQRVNFAVVAAADIGQIRSWGHHRGWSQLRLVSSAGSSFKTDLQFQDTEGKQHPGLSVFMLSPEGQPIHFYSVSAYVAEKEYRGIDLYTPLWHLLDLTPEGRGDWMPSLEYE